VNILSNTNKRPISYFYLSAYLAEALSIRVRTTTSRTQTAVLIHATVSAQLAEEARKPAACRGTSGRRRHAVQRTSPPSAQTSMTRRHQLQLQFAVMCGELALFLAVAIVLSIADVSVEDIPDSRVYYLLHSVCVHADRMRPLVWPDCGRRHSKTAQSSNVPSYAPRCRSGVYTPCRKKKCATFIFTITSANVDQVSFFFTVEFRKDPWRKPELKLAPPIKSVATLPCEK